MMKKLAAIFLLALTLFTLGCAGEEQGADGAKKTFTLGDTTFNAENEEPSINPHEAYAGWACIRYGVGETLFKISDTMELTPWLATGFTRPDENTWVITLRDGVKFSSGRALDAAAAKECLEHLIAVHARARGDLKLASIEADGQTLTLMTSEPNPALLNYLSEPYACLIDMQAGTEGGMVAGTGPYIATELVPDNHLKLKKNESYWEKPVKVDEITVRTITDGDTLAFALQSGEIDAAYGLAYASYPLFENDKYRFTSTPTSRSFYCQMNFASPVTSDGAVREAVAMGLDKESFVHTLLNGYGYAGAGAFPESFPFGQGLKVRGYDPEGAKAVLEAAGWRDTDGDGVREKDGVRLVLRWLTYPSRQELPLLAEFAQGELKKIGIEVVPNITAEHNAIARDRGAWDIYAGANVNCGLGDPMNFFSTHCLATSSKNRGGYQSAEAEELAALLGRTFDAGERIELTRAIEQRLLDDNAFIFCSFLRMSMVMKANVKGLTAHAADFYELTADLDVGE